MFDGKGLAGSVVLSLSFIASETSGRRLSLTKTTNADCYFVSSVRSSVASEFLASAFGL